jgi:hypothetical protein
VKQHTNSPDGLLVRVLHTHTHTEGKRVYLLVSSGQSVSLSGSLVGRGARGQKRSSHMDKRGRCAWTKRSSRMDKRGRRAEEHNR